MLNTNYNLLFQEGLYSHGHKKNFSLGLYVCACVDVCICLSVSVINRREVMRRDRNFGIIFTKIVCSVVQDRSLIKVSLIMFRSALQQIPFPMTFIKLSLKNVS